MPDRRLNQTADIFIDFPGSTEVQVTIGNPIGSNTIESAEATEVAPGRFKYTISLVDMSGIWRATWENQDNVVKTQEFTVGVVEPHAVTAFQLRTAVCSSVSEVVHGRIYDAFGDQMTDPTIMAGAGNFTGYWLLVEEPGLIVPRRVHSFTGNGFVVAPEFDDPPPTGQNYIITDINPYEVDNAIKTVFGSLGPIARIGVHVPNIPVSGGKFPVPRGLNYIHRVIIDGQEVPHSKWEPVSGRQIKLTGHDNTQFAEVIGIRDATPPIWEDSFIEFNPDAVSSGVASLLHAARARGQGQDMQEHFRRGLAARDNYRQDRAQSAGRPYPGTRLVVD